MEKIIFHPPLTRTSRVKGFGSCERASSIYRLLRPWIFHLDPEQAHSAATPFSFSGGLLALGLETTAGSGFAQLLLAGGGKPPADGNGRLVGIWRGRVLGTSKSAQ